MELAQYLDKLENNLLLGSARWVADFTESFRDYQIDSITFDMVVTGKMRTKGFLLSRIVSFLLMPNYYAACLVYSGELDTSKLRKLWQLATDYAEREELRWVLLVLPQPEAQPRKVRGLLEGLKSENVAVALVDLEAEEVTTNDTYLARRIRRYVEVFR